MGDNFIRITQLPESSRILPTDYLAIENAEDTWKIQFRVFNEYINSVVQDKVQSDITVNIDQQISEIHIQMGTVDGLITDLNEKVVSFDQAEERRNKQEESIAQNEAIRQQVYEETRTMVDQWVDDEKDRKEFHETMVNDWKDMNTTWDTWSDTEDQRISDENDRKQAELNRASAEAEREKKADEMFKQGEIANTNEANRITVFNEMTNYFKNIKESLDNYVNNGKTVFSDIEVRDILKIVLPVENHGYDALISFVNAATGGFATVFALSIDFEYSGDSITGGNAVVKLLKNNSVIDLNNDIRVGYTRIDDDKVEIIMQYKCSEVIGRHDVSIIWDNISTYKPDNLGIYARVLKDQPPQTAFSSTRLIMSISSSNTINNFPQEFINLFDQINGQIADMINDIKPFKMFPVGSIYMTTSSQNPCDILGGGSWRALYGGNAISEGLTDMNGNILNSPSIYYWERTA